MHTVGVCMYRGLWWVLCIYCNVLPMNSQEEKNAKDEVIITEESEKPRKIKVQSLASLQQRCDSLQAQLEKVQERNQYLEVSNFR